MRTEHGLYTYLDDDAQRILQVDWTNQTFFERGGWDPSSWSNPWASGHTNGAPFDEDFFIIFNLVDLWPRSLSRPIARDGEVEWVGSGEPWPPTLHPRPLGGGWRLLLPRR